MWLLLLLLQRRGRGEERASFTCQFVLQETLSHSFLCTPGKIVEVCQTGVTIFPRHALRLQSSPLHGLQAPPPHHPRRWQPRLSKEAHLRGRCQQPGGFQLREGLCIDCEVYPHAGIYNSQSVPACDEVGEDPSWPYTPDHFSLQAGSSTNFAPIPVRDVSGLCAPLPGNAKVESIARWYSPVTFTLQQSGAERSCPEAAQGTLVLCFKASQVWSPE
jgi:hypothetical protein